MSKVNAKALSTAVPSIKSTLAPCRGLSNQIIPVFLPVHIPDLPQYGVPTRYHSLAGFISILVRTHLSSTSTSRPSHNEIPYQSISLMPTIHIFHYCCYILIFPVSLYLSPFFTTIKFTVISHSIHSFPSAPYHLSPCLLLTGA